MSPNQTRSEPMPDVTDAEEAAAFEDIAKLFHQTYERLAPDFGYETRRESAVPWEAVPENNRKLMTATVRGVVDELERRFKMDNKTRRCFFGVCVAQDVSAIPLLTRFMPFESYLPDEASEIGEGES